MDLPTYEQVLIYLIGLLLSSMLMSFNDEDEVFSIKEILTWNLFFWYVIILDWFLCTLKKSLEK